MTKKRLSKFLAAAGIASRRAAEELIFSGKVSLNGEVVLLPQTLVDESDEILIQGKKIEGPEKKLYFLLNKPKGYLCTTVRNSKNSRLVLDLFEEEKERLFTVGRLDKETEGLMIVTNDGHFANRVIHPSSNISKEYVVKADQEITDLHLKAISAGTLVEGVFVKPLKVSKVRRSTLKVVVGEGKKREVRLLLEAAGLKTLELTRIRVGGLTLGPLEPGQYRPLSEKERNSIFSSP